MDARKPAVGGQTYLGVPLVDRLVLVVGLPVLVVVLGFALPPLARWALSWEVGLPMGFLFRLFAGIDRPWEIAVNTGIWLAVAAGVALTTMTESLKLTLLDTELRVEKGEEKRTIPRADIAAVFLDGKKVVVLDHGSRQLVRDTHEAAQATIADAFRGHGYPWRDTDPYADLYRAWHLGTTDLPPAVHDLFAIRESALRKKAHKEVGELRAAIEKLGYAVRDEGSQQHWRPLVRS
ncbi:YqeB family protein [Polymorphospora rubra]|uniref:YqeB family protein n=1 Tax=Polymorphospora rubra TaxID=338584 RepID=UPI003409F44B